MDRLTALARSWLGHADLLQRYGDERGADLVRTLAHELREEVRQVGREDLTLSEAAEESGYSKSHLRHLVADGVIPNAGRRGSPRIRRADLPVKPGTQRAGGPGKGVSGPRSAVDDARDILRSVKGGAP